MVSVFKLNCKLVIISFFLPLVRDAVAFRFSKKGKGSLSVEAPDYSTKLTALVRPMPDDHSGLYAQALELLISLQTSPSCNRIATSTLLDSCQSIDGLSVNGEESLDDIRSIYAAQLAMCEITSADSAVPHSCKALAPEQNTNFHQNKGTQEMRKSQLSECLQSLESRPQWWTSYSNNRQNAVVICQAARVDIEKDELIKLHKSTLETHSDASAALSRAVKLSNQSLSQAQKAFRTAKQAFQEQLLRDIDLSSKRVQSFFEQLMQSMDNAVQMTLSKVTSATRVLESDVASLNKNVHKANTDSVDLQRHVGKVFQKVVEGSSELAATQTRHWESNSRLASQLQDSLRDLKEVELNHMAGMFESLSGQMQISNELVASIYSKQNHMGERLDNLDQSFSRLQTKAQSLHDAQLQQAETQSRLHDLMEIDMQVARGLLDDVTISATRLQASVQDTSSKIAHVVSLAWIANSIWNWGRWPLASGFLVIVIYLFSARYARYAAVAMGTTMLFDTMFQELFSTSSTSSDIDLLPALGKVGILFGIILPLAIKYHYTKRRRTEDRSDLPFLGMAMSERAVCTWHV